MLTSADKLRDHRKSSGGELNKWAVGAATNQANAQLHANEAAAALQTRAALQRGTGRGLGASEKCLHALEVLRVFADVVVCGVRDDQHVMRDGRHGVDQSIRPCTENDFVALCDDH
jgi:hypothetical protein